MTRWYRAAQQAEIKEVFSGIGGLFAAGRWHHRGTQVVYCSASISLCTLEWLSHNGLNVSGFSYYRFMLDVPDELIHHVPPANLPKEWNQEPASDITREFANEFLFMQDKFLALALPSVMVPEELNLVINPRHRAYESVLKTVQSLGRYEAPLRDKK